MRTKQRRQDDTIQADASGSVADSKHKRTIDPRRLGRTDQQDTEMADEDIDQCAAPQQRGPDDPQVIEPASDLSGESYDVVVPFPLQRVEVLSGELQRGRLSEC